MMKALKYAVILVTVFLFSIFVDILIDLTEKKDSATRLMRQMNYAAQYTTTIQEEYFENSGTGGTTHITLPAAGGTTTNIILPSPFNTASYLNYLTDMSATSDEYLQLCVGLLDGDTDSTGNRYTPAMFNLAYIDEDLVRNVFTEYLTYLVKTNFNGLSNQIILNNVTVTVTPSYTRYSPEVLRSIYGNDDTISNLFDNLDSSRYTHIDSVLSKDRLLPSFSIDVGVDYTYVSKAVVQSRAINEDSMFANGRNNYPTAAEVAQFEVSPNYLKYPMEHLDLTYIYVNIN